MEVAIAIGIVNGLAIITIGWGFIRFERRIRDLEDSERRMIASVTELTRNVTGLSRSILTLASVK